MLHPEPLQTRCLELRRMQALGNSCHVIHVSLKSEYLGWREPVLRKLIIERAEGADFVPLLETEQVLAGTVSRVTINVSP
ncbi:hypothetical protein EB796_008980 [Bugula neritina]|uniref:Uncharacterized protein n=1 Tax=Bugula neritina TaxID=10212 RepID=A0A7J7K249_BUGNE|nr:hypothetical protein EB796_008980 [Bugula neritina]